jgi:hypothetical protein
VAERPLQRARVLGHLAGDRLQDLVGDRVELGLDDIGNAWRQVAPGLFCN